jgi:hypothetical protein
MKTPDVLGLGMTLLVGGCLGAWYVHSRPVATEETSVPEPASTPLLVAPVTSESTPLVDTIGAISVVRKVRYCDIVEGQKIAEDFLGRVWIVSGPSPEIEFDNWFDHPQAQLLPVPDHYIRPSGPTEFQFKLLSQ